MIRFKFDVIAALKEKGFSTYYLRNNTSIGQRTIQELNAGKVPGIKSIDIICSLLNVQIGDLLEFIPSENISSEKE